MLAWHNGTFQEVHTMVANHEYTSKVLKMMLIATVEHIYTLTLNQAQSKRGPHP